MAALDRRFAPEVRSPLAPWILCAVGMAASIATAATTGRFGYLGNAQAATTTASGYQQVLNDLSYCTPLAVAAAALQVFRERLPGARVTLAVLFLAEIATGAAAGGKQSYIIAVLAVAIPFTTARRRVPASPAAFMALGLAGLVFLLVVIPFNHAYRGTVRSTSRSLSIRQAFDEAPGILGQVAGSGNAGVLSSSAAYLLGRVREIDSPAIIMQRTPAQIGFASPAQLIEGPAEALIPRAVWPGKPILDAGYEFSLEYYEAPVTDITYSAITPVGDLWLHGGWIPVIAGMFLIGCLARLFDDVMDVHASPHCIFLFLLLYPILVAQEEDWTQLIANIPGVLLVWLFATYLTFRKRKRTIAAQAP